MIFDIGELESVLTKLLLWGPFLYFGLLMVIDPPRVAERLGAIAEELDRIEQRMLRRPRPARASDDTAAYNTPAAHMFVRLIGFSLAVVSLLHLLDLLDA